jgi:hypothetical protein
LSIESTGWQVSASGTAGRGQSVSSVACNRRQSLDSQDDQRRAGQLD